MKVLVINSGSSSIKYKLFDMSDRTVLASGLLEQIGESKGRCNCEAAFASREAQHIVHRRPIANHQEGFQLMGAALRQAGALDDVDELFGIGHRVVHGGELFRDPAVITQSVVDTIRRLIPLAPLHNPANLLGIEVTLKRAPNVPQVAVFDTAFHQSMPPHSFRYGLPQEWYDRYHIRRYGFHGTSHCHVTKQAALFLNRSVDALNLITLHLGNGASIAAIEKGRSVDTSMGMTPLEGLIMGTRSGDIDPAIVLYFEKEVGKTIEEMESLLNKESGLKGICGTNDMREVVRLAEAGDTQAKLAIDMYCYRIRKYIGAYWAVLGHLDAIVFTGGIGENAAAVRSEACRGLAPLGIEIDHRKNSAYSGNTTAVNSEGSATKVIVIPANEELEIAEQTVEKIQSR